MGVRRPGGTGVDTGCLHLAFAPGSVIEHAAAADTDHAEQVLLLPGRPLLAASQVCFTQKAWLIILEELKTISVFFLLRECLQTSLLQETFLFFKTLRFSKSPFYPVGKRQSVSRGL